MLPACVRSPVSLWGDTANVLSSNERLDVALSIDGVLGRSAQPNAEDSEGNDKLREHFVGLGGWGYEES